VFHARILASESEFRQQLIQRVRTHHTQAAVRLPCRVLEITFVEFNPLAGAAAAATVAASSTS
jgi:hypothetical protein